LITNTNVKTSVMSILQKGDRNCLYRAEKKCPRLYNIIFFVVVPLLLLICWCKLCGYFLARLEREYELRENMKEIREYEEEHHSMNRAIGAVQKSYDECIDIFMNDSMMDPSSDLINGTELKVFVQNCTTIGVEESKNIIKKEVGDKEMVDLTSNHLSFNWNTCSEDGKNMRSYEQGKFLYEKWNENRNEKYKEIMELADNNNNNDGDEDSEDAYLQAIQDTVIPEGLCKLNPAGGAIFWFTVMTTVGYGNAAPKTGGGQIFVVILGFISILAFATVAGSTGHVVLAIIDDVFIRLKMERLTKGWISLMFWMSMIVLSMLCVAGIAAAYTSSRYDGDVRPMGELLWFAFITITTVGLGDIYIPHDAFHQKDMFYVPFALLLGYVCVANFFIKMSNMLHEFSKRSGIPDNEVIDDLLLQQRSIQSQNERDENDCGIHHDDYGEGKDGASSQQGMELVNDRLNIQM